MAYNMCGICKNIGECYTMKYSDSIRGKRCLNCVLDSDWFFPYLIRKDRKKIKKLLKQRKKEREEVELENEIIENRDKYDDFYAQIENVKKIKEKERYCKFCKERKMTKFKIIEHLFDIHAICTSCLGFIAGMDNQAKWGRKPPP